MRIIATLFFVFAFHLSFAQKKVVAKISAAVNGAEARAHLGFLAADEMRGRDTGSPEIDIAANYLSTQFQLLGVKTAPGQSSYFQEVQLNTIFSATEAVFSIDTAQFRLTSDILVFEATDSDLQKEVVYVGYGTPADFDKVDVAGKIVVALAGTPQTKTAVDALLNDAPAKRELASGRNAAALIEIMALPGVPWPGLVRFLSSTKMNVQNEKALRMPHLLMRNTDHASIRLLQEKRSASGRLKIQIPAAELVRSKNVIGVVEGTDPKLKNEWIAVSAHYDHVGVKKNQSADSIFNGARDNAIGTVAILQAAKYFAANKPKRSLVFIALTGEEVGLLGSAWYAEHPVVPLESTVFNMNCDGAGYNDTSIMTIIDFNRTTADEQLKKACQTFGLTLTGDPAPEQNLYERSDNFNFAIKGVPAVDVAPGIKAFDQGLFKYYHQPADEVGTLDMNYLEKFFRSFVYGTSLLANDATRPTWKKGDKFEQTGQLLDKGK